MSNVMNLVRDRLGEQELRKLGSIIDADPRQTERGVAAAVPVLLGGLARNANGSSEGAASLDRALERDHDGTVLDDLDGLLAAAESMLGGRGGGGTSAKALDGAGILEHILGGRRGTVERGIGRASGLDASQIAKLLPLLAPIVMSALGKLKRRENLDAGDLASRLEKDAREVEGKTGLGELIGGLLDSDGDGRVLDELGRLAGDDALGSVLRGR